MEEKRIVWKPVVGYEGLYEVNNYCQIKSLNYNKTGKEKILATHKNDLNYFKVALYKNSVKKYYYIHVLGSKAFLPNPDSLPYVNHKDCNPANNYIHINKDGSVDPAKSNLEFCTQSYNINYADRNEKVADKLGKPVLQYSLSGDFIKEYKSASEAERQTGVSIASISMCCTGKRKVAGTKEVSYIWRYKDAS